MTGQRKYRGFISYCRADARWAARLHRRLETYRPPAGVGPGNGRPTRLGRFFRDDDELAGSTSLGAALRGAIEDSESLIVVCSPDAARSPWVDREIRHFKTRGDGSPVFAVIVRGIPHAANAAEECFPEALRFAVDPSGALTTTPDEPLAPNVSAESLTRVVVRLAAGMLRVDFDQLWRRERRRRAARRLGALTVLVTLAATAGYGFVQSQRASSVVLSRAVASSAAAILDAFWTAELDDDQPIERAVRYGLVASRETLLQRGTAFGRSVLARASEMAPLVATLDLASGPVAAVAVSPDGRMLATAGAGGEVEIRTFDRLDVPRRVANLGAPVTRLEFSAHGTLLVATTTDSSAAVIRADSTQSPIRLPDHAADVVFAGASPDESIAYTSSFDGFIRFWSAASGTLRWQSRQPVAPGVFGGETARHARFSADGRTVAVPGPGHDEITLLDPKGGSRLGGYSTGGVSVNDFAMSPDGSLLALSAQDGSFSVIEIATGARRFTVEAVRSDDLAALSAQDAVAEIAFLARGSRLYTRGRDGQVSIWDARSGARISQIQGLGRIVLDASIDPTQRFLVTASMGDPAQSSVARVWDIESGDEQYRLHSGDGALLSVAYADSGRRIVALTESGKVLVWDVVRQPIGGVTVGHRSTVRSVALRPNGDQLVSAEDDGVLRIWDARAGRSLAAYGGRARGEPIVGSGPIVMDPRGRFAAIAAEATTVLVWDFAASAPVRLVGSWGARRVNGPSAYLDHLTVSRDGSYLVVTHHQQVDVWDTGSWKRLAALSDTTCPAQGADMDPGRSLVLTANRDGSACLFELPAGRLTGHWNAGVDYASRGWFTGNGETIVIDGRGRTTAWNARTLGRVGSIAYRKDHRQVGVSVREDRVLLATIDDSPHAEDFRVSILDPIHGGEITRLAGHELSVSLVSFSTDGRFVVSASFDRSARVWELPSGIEVARLLGHQHHVLDAVFSSDLRTVATASSDLTGRLWSLGDAMSTRGAAQLETVCRRLGNRQSILTEEDVRRAPMLADRLGDDVCKRPSVGAEIARWLRGRGSQRADSVDRRDADVRPEGRS